MPFDAFDLAILRFLTRFTGVSGFIDQSAYLMVKLDICNGVMFMAFFWMAWFTHAKKDTSKIVQDRQNHLLIVLMGTLLAVALSRALQHVFHVHQRPLVAGLGIPFAPLIDPSSLNDWNSMPSDHAVLFFALAAGLYRSNKLIGMVSCLWASLIICLPRVYLGMHYPSDVIVGAILGVLWMLAFERLPLERAADKVLDWRGRHPGLFYAIAFVVTDQIADMFDDIRLAGAVLAKYFGLLQ